MKQLRILSNGRKGENLFHCWNADLSFYVYTQNGKRGIDAAYADINKGRELGARIVMSITHCAYKNRITGWYR